MWSVFFKFFIEFRATKKTMARVHLNTLSFNHVRGHYCNYIHYAGVNRVNNFCTVHCVRCFVLFYADRKNFAGKPTVSSAPFIFGYAIRLNLIEFGTGWIHYAARTNYFFLLFSHVRQSNVLNEKQACGLFNRNKAVYFFIKFLFSILQNEKKRKTSTTKTK